MVEEALKETIVKQSKKIRELETLIKRKDEYIEILRREKQEEKEKNERKKEE